MQAHVRASGAMEEPPYVGKRARGTPQVQTCPLAGDCVRKQTGVAVTGVQKPTKWKAFEYTDPSTAQACEECMHVFCSVQCRERHPCVEIGRIERDRVYLADVKAGKVALEVRGCMEVLGSMHACV